MLKLFDTSVVVAALSVSHTMHEVARPRLANALDGNIQMAVSAHLLAEAYSTLTVLQVQPRITPTEARRLLDANVLSIAAVVPLDASDYEAVVARMAELGLVSGAVYDGLHVRAAEKAGADELLTFNGRDFRRMPPSGDTELVVL